jgi:Putative RNA methyltransferase
MLDPKDYGRPGKKMAGKVVSPAAPREDNGTYWGYTTRIANSIQKVFEECPFDGGYDLKIGTSERTYCWSLSVPAVGFCFVTERCLHACSSFFMVVVSVLCNS